jgi:hypothetical protein
MKKTVIIIVGVILLFFACCFLYLHWIQNTGTQVANVSLLYKVKRGEAVQEELFSIIENKLLILSRQKPLCFVLKNGRPIIALDSSEMPAGWGVYKVELPASANEMISTFYNLQVCSLKQLLQQEVNAEYFSQVDMETFNRISGKKEPTSQPKKEKGVTH